MGCSRVKVSVVMISGACDSVRIIGRRHGFVILGRLVVSSRCRVVSPSMSCICLRNGSRPRELRKRCKRCGGASGVEDVGVMVYVVVFNVIYRDLSRGIRGDIAVRLR